MEHVVFHPGPDGSPAYCRVPSLAAALARVEQLRNVEGVEDVTVHALAEVPVAFRPWLRAEVPADPGGSDVSASVQPWQPAQPLEPAQLLLESAELLEVGSPCAPALPAERTAPAQTAHGPVVPLRREGLRGVGFFA